MPKPKDLVPPLLAWFAEKARDLPWRHTRDPYAVWVSEVMLQQTQVRTVMPYWERWMDALPTIGDLAAATPDRVLKLWEGLGYYTRARHLHEAAQLIVALHQGRFPTDFSQVLALPGIGRYTAGAICSIAFNQPTPVLDGNVSRVLTRVFGIQRNPRERQINAQLWQLAEALVQTAHRMELAASGHRCAAATKPNPSATCHPPSPGESCSHLNQALMELGALVCLPREPDCVGCPLRRACRARRLNLVAQLPARPARVVVTQRRFMAFVFESRGRFLVQQRADGSLNARLWEFPNAETDGPEREPLAVAEGIAGVPPRSLSHLCRIKHSITRYRNTVDAFHAPLRAASRRRPHPGAWLTLVELDRLAFTSAHRKILRELQSRQRRSARTSNNDRR